MTRASDRKFFREASNRARHHEQVGMKKSSPDAEVEPRIQTVGNEAGTNVDVPEYREGESPGIQFDGHVKFFNLWRAFGFIGFRYPDGVRDEIFFHFSDVQPWGGDGAIYAPVAGCVVTFREGWDRGRRKAIDVEVLSWPERTAEEYFLSLSELPVDEPKLVPQSTEQPIYDAVSRRKTLRQLIEEDRRRTSDSLIIDCEKF